MLGLFTVFLLYADHSTFWHEQTTVYVLSHANLNIVVFEGLLAIEIINSIRKTAYFERIKIQPHTFIKELMLKKFKRRPTVINIMLLYILEKTELHEIIF